MRTRSRVVLAQSEREQCVELRPYDFYLLGQRLSEVPADGGVVVGEIPLPVLMEGVRQEVTECGEV